MVGVVGSGGSLVRWESSCGPAHRWECWDWCAWTGPMGKSAKLGSHCSYCTLCLEPPPFVFMFVSVATFRSQQIVDLRPSPHIVFNQGLLPLSLTFSLPLPLSLLYTPLLCPHSPSRVVNSSQYQYQYQYPCYLISSPLFSLRNPPSPISLPPPDGR